MNLHPETQLGIWLNTPVKFLEKTPKKKLRNARNDASWSAAANDNELLWGKTMLSNLCFKDGERGGYLCADSYFEDAGGSASIPVRRSRALTHRLSEKFRLKKLANWLRP